MSSSAAAAAVIPRRVSVSFSGCGFLGMFHVGSLSCLRDNVDMLTVDRALGASAGAVAACALLLPEHMSTDMLREKFFSVVKDAESRPFGAFNPKFNVNKLFSDELERVLPADAHLRLSGRLTVSLTHVASMKNVLVDEFESRADLIDAVVCSCFIPGFSAYEVPTYKGENYLDGGLTNALPVLDERTIKVSPFAGSSHICPKDDTDDVAPSSSSTSASYASVLSSYIPDNFLSKKVKASLSEQEVEPSRINAQRLWNAFKPASDLESLYRQGYDLTKVYISDAEKMAAHYYRDDDDND